MNNCSSAVLIITGLSPFQPISKRQSKLNWYKQTARFHSTFCLSCRPLCKSSDF